MLTQEIHDKLVSSNSLQQNSDTLTNYMRTHPENIVLFDGETYSPEWCIELKGLGEDYKFYNDEHQRYLMQTKIILTVGCVGKTYLDNHYSNVYDFDKHTLEYKKLEQKYI